MAAGNGPSPLPAAGPAPAVVATVRLSDVVTFSVTETHLPKAVRDLMGRVRREPGAKAWVTLGDLYNLVAEAAGNGSVAGWEAHRRLALEAARLTGVEPTRTVRVIERGT